MKNTRENINRQIQYIVKHIEQNVLEVCGEGVDSRFFIYNIFQASYGGTSNSVTYNSGQLLEITDFLEIPHAQIEGTGYKQAFARYIETCEFLNIQFSDNYKYWRYAP